MRVISYRPPLWARIWCAAFCSGLSAWVVTANTADYAGGRAGAGVYVPVTAMVLILMAFAYRVFRLSFRADAAGVVVRNVFFTRRVPVTEIAGFEVGARFLMAPNAVRVITESGTYPISAIGRYPDLLIDHLCDVADELEDWLENARAGLP